MPDLKINDKVYNGVEKVQIPLADDSGNAEFIQPVIEALTVTENGTIEAPNGVNGYSPVVVNIPMPAPVIQPLEVTENGTFTAPDGVDGYSPVTVNVAASGGGGGVEDFDFVTDTHEAHITVITVGANTITNTVEAWNYFDALVDGDLMAYALLSEPNTKNQLGLHDSTHNSHYRWNGDAYGSAGHTAEWDAAIVKGTRYLLMSTARR